METSSEDELAMEPFFTHSTQVRSSIRPSPLPRGPKTSQITKAHGNEDRTQERSASRNLANLSPHHLPLGSTSGTETTSNFTLMPNRQLIVPKSRYGGYTPPIAMCKERIAVNELLEKIEGQTTPVPGVESSSNGEEFDQIELSDFAIYLPGSSTSYHPFEMRGLQHLFLPGHSYLLFDGILRAGECRRYVQGVPFKICSIGNYGEEHHTVGSNIWIKSDLNARSDVYYKLASPSTEYFRFHEGFLWLADLAKHFVDYCQASKFPVSVQNFRADFSKWIQHSHRESAAFQNWYGAYQRGDFRHAICRNVDFLFKESIGVDEKLRSHPIWNEILEQDSVKFHAVKETKTIVTPYVYDCFSHLKFGSHLRVLEPVKNVKFQQTSQDKDLHLTAADAFGHIDTEVPNPQGERSNSKKALDVAPTVSNLEHKIRSIKVGKVIAVAKDAESVWKDEISRWKVADECWYFLIQEIHTDRGGKRSFHGIWLYKPSDTSCAKMKYPYPNELFLSDNCTCGQARITTEEILDVIAVDWYGHPAAANQRPFIRQTYVENERFIALQEEHKTCEHFKNRNEVTFSKTTSIYPVGRTVLATPPQQRKSKYALEVYEILKYVQDETNAQVRVVLRLLQRRSVFHGKGMPNELVYTNIQEKLSVARIHSQCLVRCFAEGEPISAPYNRHGSGNTFYITYRRVVGENRVPQLVPLETYPRSLIQGFDPEEAPSQKKLRGMDLYCGGGNFGRGLEEGGAVQNCYAVDLDKAAIHTYNANLKAESTTKLFFGSVDDLISEAMEGNPKGIDSVPLPGDVDFISAGSPCQGFSLLNSHKDNDKSLKNQSLVASVAAYVDFYRPKYGLLENVISMAQKGRGRDEDVLSQLVCALVGMGYQTRLILLDAWSSGSPQSRSRLFVSFAAPDMEPLEHPALSHSHPSTITQRGLGKLANGKSFGSRDLNILTPFNYITASESVKDLPVIGDGMTGHCIRFPDHILEHLPTESLRRQIQAIPIYPRGSNFAKAWNEGNGTMSKEDRLLFPAKEKENGTPRTAVQPSSCGWERAHPHKLLGTITVTMQMASARGAPTIHWNESRNLTIMEYRRAQSFPDEEILIGSRSQCLKIIGNSVARTVAVSLGLKLREAWLKDKPNPESILKNIPSGSFLGDKDIRERPQINHALPITQSPTQASNSSRAMPIVIPDSTEISDDDGDVDNVNPLSVPTLRRLLDALPADMMVATLNTNENSHTASAKANVLKRPHAISQNARLPHERTLKSPRLLSPSSTSSSTSIFQPSNSRKSSGKTPKKSLESNSLAKVPYIVTEQAFLSPSKPKTQHKGIIDLTSDNEDDAAKSKEASANPPVISTLYKPVDNSQFAAYTQTNIYMNHDVQRKHESISRSA